MSVIVELEVAAREFELGRILQVAGEARIEMETVVPAAERAVPLFWVYNDHADAFEAAVGGHPTVNRITAVDVFEDRALYAINWDASSDEFFGAVVANGGNVLNATGRAERWLFEIRLPSHGNLGNFQDDLEDADLSVEVLRVYNPTKPDAGPWYGLTPTQREALVLAVESGYYDIPRTCTTVELGEQLGISDQAVTERLRRAIVNLVDNSLLVAQEE
ncbi:MAG: helix-turn-helix domain-containing protein [Haloarculaceae archaeon]